ncbi:hypothetical protein [Azomonas agilis]|nr:hypothetical protein [Azomonas agilis]
MPKVMVDQIQKILPPAPSPATSQVQRQGYNRPNVPPTVDSPIRLPTPEELDAQGRQVVFNSQNYQPNANVNIIPSPQTQFVASRTQAAPQPKKSGITKKSAPWHWIGADGDLVPGSGELFTWLEIEGHIDYSTVCQNYKQGSFVYRDCRKGAKQSFARMCKQGTQPACHAANNYMP